METIFALVDGRCGRVVPADCSLASILGVAELLETCGAVFGGIEHAGPFARVFGALEAFRDAPKRDSEVFVESGGAVGRGELSGEALDDARVDGDAGADGGVGLGDGGRWFGCREAVYGPSDEVSPGSVGHDVLEGRDVSEVRLGFV